MTQYKYTGGYTLVYTHKTDLDGKPLIAVPGQTYNIDTAPDTLWKAVSSSKKAPEAPVEPSTPEPESTPTQSESEPQ
jgi:hypothetical protein